MRWTYLPIVFALSFIYTKMSYTDFLPKRESPVRLSRKPASAEELKTLRPVRAKISPATFYKELTPNDVTTFTFVMNYQGVIVSDVHVENFGFVVDDNKKSSYSVFNFSQASTGLLFHDVMMHLTSAKALDKRVVWLEYFEAYKKGLKGESLQHSFYIEKGLSEALIDSEKIIAENMTSDYPIEFTKIRRKTHHVGPVEKNLVMSELKKLFPKIEVFDFVESNKNKGSYQLLARLRPTDQVEWLKIKENTKSEHDNVFEVSEKPSLVVVKDVLYSGRLDKSLHEILIDKKKFTLKFAHQFSSKLNFNEIPVEDYRDILLDQAYVLGAIHKKSLSEQRVDEYIRSWAKIPASIIDERVDELMNKFSK
jgi:hypothetical protein